MQADLSHILAPLTVAAVMLAGSLLVYGVAMHLVVRVVVRLFRTSHRELGFWKSTAVMAIVTLITVAAHLTQIALWALVLVLCGQVLTWKAACYLSAQNYTALGYGDIALTEPWQLLGPIEAINGLLFFGLSTAVLFAIMNYLILNRLRHEIGFPGGPTDDHEMTHEFAPRTRPRAPGATS